MFAPQRAEAAIDPHNTTHTIGSGASVVGSALVLPAQIAAPAEQPTPPAVPRKSLPKQINPNPLNRWVIVKISEQRVYFYQDGKVVRTNLVSTGLPGHDTNLGTWKVWRRVANERMVGDGYDLSGVLYTQYFDPEMEALHYAWWHNNWGHKMSHGCVNMDLATSKFAWNFGFIGMTVKVVQ